MLALAPVGKVGKGCLDNAMTIGYPAPGTEVAGYRIEQLLGRGGMGAVYRALDVRLGRPVALKLLVAGAAPERLLRESQLAARLDHPNVIPIYEAGHQDGRLFIAMRYVAGGDLKTLLRREGALPPARSVAIAAQVADALDAAHRRGLVHRDVKPSNILLDCEDEREHCYLADFGLTQSSTDRGPADGHGMGTIDYVAPEQIRGEPLDGRADQYALACLLFESLTGSVPYRSRSDVAAIFAHLEEPVPRPSEREAELPAAIDAVLARGMAKRSEDRFESCSALVSQARAALGLVARPRSPRRRLAALVAAVLVVAAVVTVVTLGRGASAPAAPTGSLTRVDARTNRVLKRTPVDGHPGNLAVTPGGIWMTDFVDGVLWRYEAAAGRLERITSNGEPRDLAALDGKVYVAADGRFLSGVVSRYDASSGVREEGIDRLACAVASGEGVLWVAGCPFVQRLSTGRREAARAGEGLPPIPLAGDGRERARAVPRARDRCRLAVGARRRAGSPDVAARRAHRSHPADDRARLPAHFRDSGRRDRLDHRRAQRSRRPGGRRDGPRTCRGARRPRRERHRRWFGLRLGREHARRHGVAHRSREPPGRRDDKGRRAAAGPSRRQRGGVGNRV